MKKLSAVLFSLLLTSTISLEARGMARGPSMSRAAAPRAANRPLGNRVDRPDSRGDLNRFTADRPGEFNRGALERDPNFANAVRNNFDRDGLGRGNWFNNDFWRGRGFAPPYLAAGRNWWGWATAAGVGSWLGWAGDPVYYGSYEDDEDDGSDNQQSTSNAPSPPPQQQQSYANQQANPAPQGDWMPLGVFALTQGTNSNVTPNLYLQLALKRDGTLAGTLFNDTTNQTTPIMGILDKETQRVVMQAVGTELSPILDTGIYDLTRPETAVQIHFNDGTTQQMMLVRMSQPTS